MKQLIYTIIILSGLCRLPCVAQLIGDYSENPFEGLNNDIPMLSICRTIEIDLLQILGESQVPKPIQSKNGVLL
jgi:putative membrane protein